MAMGNHTRGKGSSSRIPERWRRLQNFTDDQWRTAERMHRLMLFEEFLEVIIKRSPKRDELIQAACDVRSLVRVEIKRINDGLGF